MGGPDMAPHTPRRSDRPGEAVAILDIRSHLLEVDSLVYGQPLEVAAQAV